MPKYSPDPLDRVFAALADGTRRDVVARLVADGEATVSGLAGHYAMALPSFTQHLDVLEQARLIARVKIGRQRHVTFQAEGLTPLADWLEAIAPAPARGVGTGPLAVPTPAHAVASDALIGKAAALARRLAPSLAVVEQALAPAAADEAFTPITHAARRLAQVMREAPELVPELEQALALYKSLNAQLAATAHGGSVEALKATSLPLGRAAFAWGEHPLLRELLVGLAPEAA